MQSTTVQCILGRLPEELPGQWIDAVAIVESDQHFLFGADLCQRIAADQFSLHQVGVRVQQPFSAEVLLGLLLVVAEAPFQRSRSGFETTVDGPSDSVRMELCRVLKPEVRRNADPSSVPNAIRQELGLQMAGIAIQRNLQDISGDPRPFD